MLSETPGWYCLNFSNHFCASTVSTSEDAPLNVPVSFSLRGTNAGSAESSAGCRISGGGSSRPRWRPDSACSGVCGLLVGSTGITHSTMGRASCATAPAANNAAPIAITILVIMRFIVVLLVISVELLQLLVDVRHRHRVVHAVVLDDLLALAAQAEAQELAHLRVERAAQRLVHV